MSIRIASGAFYVGKGPNWSTETKQKGTEPLEPFSQNKLVSISMADYCELPTILSNELIEIRL